MEFNEKSIIGLWYRVIDGTQRYRIESVNDQSGARGRLVYIKYYYEDEWQFGTRKLQFVLDSLKSGHYVVTGPPEPQWAPELIINQYEIF
jgi:hypothetical protein